MIKDKLPSSPFHLINTKTATSLITKLKKINDNLNANEPEDYDSVKIEISEARYNFSDSSKELKEIQIKINKMTLVY